MATAQTGTILLSLTKDEARALHTVLSFVGGHPETTQRGLTDNVLRALGEVGITYEAPVYDCPFEKSPGLPLPGLYFKE